MNITLTGNLGSGKSSVCKELEKRGYKIVSTGNIFRDIAKEKGVSVIELNELAKKDKSIDDLIDNRSIELGKTLDNTVFDSRLAWNFIPNSFKVFLYINADEAADRVFKGKNRNAEEYLSKEDTLQGLLKRTSLEQQRFKELYNIDYYDISNYDLILESTDATPEEIADELIAQFNLYKEKPFNTKVMLNLKNLYPTQNFKDIQAERVNKLYSLELENNYFHMQGSISITMSDGYNYILDGHHHAFAALAAGKRFAELRNIDVSDRGLLAIEHLSKKELYNFEDLGRFKYKNYPDEVPVRRTYPVNFSHFVI